MKCWCKCTGRKPLAENVFTTGSNAFVTGRKQLRMSHVRVGRRQAEPGIIERVREMLAQDWRATKIDGGGIGH